MYNTRRQDIVQEVVKIKACVTIIVTNASGVCATKLQQVKLCPYKIDVYVCHDMNAIISPTSKKNNLSQCM